MTWGNRARLAALALIWGSSFLFIKAALAGLSPVHILLARLALGAMVLLAALGLRRRRLPSGSMVWLHLTVAAVVANVVPYYLFAWAELRVPSNVAGVLNATTPLFTAVIAMGTRTEHSIAPLRAVGLLAGFVGAVVILAPWHEPTRGALEGQLACLLAAASYGVAYVYMRRFLAHRGVSALVLSASQLTIAALLTGLLAGVTARQPMALTPTVVAAVAALGALGTGFAYLLNYRLIADEGATVASTVTYLLPVVAVADGSWILHEPAGWNLLVGTTIVLLGVALTQRYALVSVEPTTASPHGLGRRPP
jgi:drug/metabolite transporter (DMT)-like permease